MIKGWHWGYKYGEGAGGLPARIYDRPSLITSWNIEHDKTQDFEQYNTSFDIWLGPIDDPNPSLPGTEIMIWLNHVGQYPIGNYRETVNIWGMNWDLWYGWVESSGTSWEVYSFVNQQGTWSINNANIYDFFDYLWAQKNEVDGRRYILGIEAGNEIMDGAGSFTHNYWLSVNGQ